MSYREIHITWENFKDMVLSENNPEWVYRGLRSREHSLNSTLARHTEADKILAGDYYTAQQLILNDEAVRKHPDFSQIRLLENPFRVALLVGNEEHENNYKKLFEFLIKMRHLGSYSPLIDWTSDINIAAWFALNENHSEEPITIYRIKIIPTPTFSPFGLNVYKSHFHFNTDGENHFRQSAQKAIHTLAIFHEHKDTVLPKEQRKGPEIILTAYEKLTLPQNVHLEKYCITDSNGSKNKTKILSTLEKDKETIYGEEDTLENIISSGKKVLNTIEEKIYATMNRQLYWQNSSISEIIQMMNSVNPELIQEISGK